MEDYKLYGKIKSIQTKLEKQELLLKYLHLGLEEAGIRLTNKEKEEARGKIQDDKPKRTKKGLFVDGVGWVKGVEK